MGAINDVGVSVRCRVVKILRDMLVSGALSRAAVSDSEAMQVREGRRGGGGGRAARVNACASVQGFALRALQGLLTRAADRREEDSVRELVKQTFEVLWFQPEGSTGILLEDELPLAGEGEGDGSEDEAPAAGGAGAAAGGGVGARGSGVRAVAMSMADRARQLVGLLAVSEDSVEWLAGMLRDVFEAPAGAAGTLGASAGDERRRRRATTLAATAATACAPLVAAIREYMLELHGDLGAGLPPEPGAPTADETAALMVACAVALRTFARAAGHLVAPHFEMLAPYVRGLEGMGAEVRGAPRGDCSCMTCHYSRRTRGGCSSL